MYTTNAVTKIMKRGRAPAAKEMNSYNEEEQDG